MAEVMQGRPLPESQRRQTWKTGSQVSRGGKFLDVEIEGAEISGATIDGATLTDATITPEAWTAPSLQNSWVDYGAPHQTARYRQDSNGVVHIQGMIKDGTVTDGTLIFTLPAGYRPSAELWFTNYAAGGATALISVAANGQVTAGAGFSATNTAINCSFAI